MSVSLYDEALPGTNFRVWRFFTNTTNYNNGLIYEENGLNLSLQPVGASMVTDFQQVDLEHGAPYTIPGFGLGFSFGKGIQWQLDAVGEEAWFERSAGGNFLQWGADFTFDFWAAFDGTLTDGFGTLVSSPIMEFADTSGLSGMLVFLDAGGPPRFFSVQIYEPARIIQVDVPYTPPTPLEHWAIVTRTLGRTLEVYRSGVLVGTVTAGTNGPALNINRIRIGLYTPILGGTDTYYHTIRDIRSRTIGSADANHFLQFTHNVPVATMEA